MNLRVVTPPVLGPVSLETVKQHLRVDGDEENALFDLYLAAALEQAEGMTRRALITQTLELILDDWPTERVLKLPRPPLQSVESVKYLDATGDEFSWTDYQVDARSEPGYLYFNNFPTSRLFPSGAISIQFVAGYGDAPTDVPFIIQQGMLIAIGHWYENREAASDLPAEARHAFLQERVIWF